MNKQGSTLLAALLLGVAALAGDVLAQDMGATLKLSTDERWGDYIVTGEGRSVYLYVLDEDGTSACVDTCTNNWPPVTVADGAQPTVGEGLDASLIGTVERPDGAVQVTYGGPPLYTFAGDAGPGATKGEGLDQFGAKWYVLAPSGDKIDNDE